MFEAIARHFDPAEDFLLVPGVPLDTLDFTSGRMNLGSKMVLDEGAKHIEQALERLEPGGRLVAIVGDSMKPEGTAAEGTRNQGSGKRQEHGSRVERRNHGA